MNRPGWTAIGVAGAKGRTYRHPSGWLVQHCGHPTARWPYYLVNPRSPRRITVSFNGLGFKILEAAQRAVEGVVAGDLTWSTRRCGASSARVLEMDAGGFRALACERAIAEARS